MPTAIVPLENIRFDNPMFSLTHTLQPRGFHAVADRTVRDRAAAQSSEFFDTARGMNFYDDQTTTTRQLFDRFFPGREDVIRLLMEPITYANGSTLEDPAITYGIVFSNFMSKGVYTFQGGTDQLVDVDARRDACAMASMSGFAATSNGFVVERGRVRGVQVNGRTIPAGAVVSNANLKATILRLVGRAVSRPAVRRASRRSAAEQQQHAGLHGAEAGRTQSTNRRETCCSVRRRPCFAPTCC